MIFDVKQIRKAFPVLEQKVNGKRLVYFDNAATTQKPLRVIHRVSRYYEEENSNVHRGVHHLSQVATDKFEQARRFVADYIHAQSVGEIIFTRGTTESINAVATVFSHLVNTGDEILVTAMEHHSNLVPWQQLCTRQKASLKVIPVNKKGELDIDQLGKMLTAKTKMLALAHVSNVLGTVNPVKEIVNLAHKKNIPVTIDGAQSIAHLPVDVSDMDCDFYAFSAHKAYGPMGIGVLYGKEKWLNQLPPYQFGGEMVDQVTLDKTTFNVLPYKFEAGTPNVAGALGMEAALRFIRETGIDQIRKHEDEVLGYATKQLSSINGMQLIGKAKDKTAVLSFVVNGLHPYDLGTLLDQMGVAVRTGYHCAQPVVESFGLTGTLRASFGLYNTLEEVDIFVDALKRSINMLK